MIIKRLMAAGMPAETARNIVGKVQSTTMAGSTAADATLITEPNVLFTTSSAGGAALPPSDAGDNFNLKNESGNTCTLYPSATAGTVTINGTTSVSLGNAKSVVVYFSSPTACHTIPTVPS